MEALILFLGLFAWSESDFLKTATEQQKQGYRWENIDCRTPNDNLPHISMVTGTGKKLVCNKLVK